MAWQNGMDMLNVARLPCPIEDHLVSVDAELFEPLMSQTNELRKPIPVEIRQALTPTGAMRLFAYAGGRAEFAVRRGSIRDIYKGLLGLLLLPEDEDFRMLYVYLTLLENSAMRLGLRPLPEFKRVAEYAVPDVRQTILDFVSQGGSSLRGMGMIEVGTGDDFCYKQRTD